MSTTTAGPLGTEPRSARATAVPRDVAARLLGGLFPAGFLCYGVGFGLVSSVVGRTDFLATVPAHRTTLTLGVLLMLMNTFVDIGKGVLFFPILRRHSLGTALAYLSALVVEVALLAIGAVFLLMLVPLSDHAATAWAGSMATVLVDANTMAYQIAELTLGAGGVALCALLVRTRLVPRPLAVWGVVGYVGLICGSLAELSGLHVSLALAIPGGLFEVALGVWLLTKGLGPDRLDVRVG